MRRRLLAGALCAAALAAVTAASAAEAPVDLDVAATYAVLGGATVTNTGPSTVTGDVGVSPGSAVTGFPPGEVREGAVHAADAHAAEAQAAAGRAYDDAAGRGPPAEAGELGGRTLAPGVYRSPTALALTGTVTLDGQGDSRAVFVLQAGSTLVTATGSRVTLAGGAQACNVFWQVGSSATLGVDSAFAGTVIALASVAAQTRAVVVGRLLARNGEVTLDTNDVTRPTCAAEGTDPTPTTATTAPGGDGTDTTATTAPSGGAPGDGGDGGSEPGTGTPSDDGTPDNDDGTPGNGAPPRSDRPAPNGDPPVRLVPPSTDTRIPRTGAPASALAALGLAALAVGVTLRWRT